MKKKIIKLLQRILNRLKKVDRVKPKIETPQHIIYRNVDDEHVTTEYRFNLDKEFLGIFVNGKIHSEPKGKVQYLDNKISKQLIKNDYKLVD